MSRVSVGLLRTGFALAAGLLLAACASRNTSSQTRADIPRLEQELAAQPGNGATTLALAAALLEADRCGEALPLARRGIGIRPQDALGPLVAGECLEQSGDTAGALAIYDAFVAQHGANIGAPAVGARALLIRRSVMTQEARRLVARESELSAEPGDPGILAVAPFEVIADSAYAPLAPGLASMITSDLALLRSFRLVERAELDAIMREFALTLGGVTDPATAARAGRLLRAGTVVHGVALIPPDDRVRLQVTLLDETGTMAATETLDGRAGDLLHLEKQLVLSIADALGYQVTEAERIAIMENGTRNLAAFLAWSRGLLDEDGGNYAAAAAHYADAARQDPAFRQARSAHRAAAAVSIVRNSDSRAAAAATTEIPSPLTPTGDDAAASAITAGVMELAPTHGERVTGGSAGTDAASTPISTPPPGVVSQTYVFGFRIVLELP